MTNFIAQHWPILLAIVNVILAFLTSAHAVLWKRDGRAVISWVGLIWLSPIIGAALYFVFGINRIRRRAVSAKVRRAWTHAYSRSDIKKGEVKLQAFLADHQNLSGLVQLGQAISKRVIEQGNSVTPLMDGDEAYPAMLDAIAEAQHTITLLIYIFDSDRAGEAFFRALVSAHKRGVKVRVLIDDVGSKYGKPNMVGRLKEAGVHAESFLPTRLPWIGAANLRNHRKILVVDGKIGFTGGTNIREGHWLSLGPKAPVQCLHFSIEGPVVAHLQEVFAIDWAFTTGEALAGNSWFPTLEKAGTVWARGVAHGPDEDFRSLSNAIAGALSIAQHRVRIVTPYFLPDASLIHALQVTALRGVEVEIFVPEHCNIKLVQWAMAAQLWQVLEKGCRVYYTAPPFDHTKLMVVDDEWSLIGSTNWDPRSLRLNFEFNVECYDPDLVARLNTIIENKKRLSRETSLKEVDQRMIAIRLRDGLARLLSPYL